MVNSKYIVYLIFFLSLPAFASKSAEYPVSEIADSLKRNAGAVVRYNKVTLAIDDIHKYTYSEEKVISILNTSQEELAEVKLWYTDRDIIRDFKAWLYDADGNVVKHLDKRDVEDYSATPGFVLAGTGRVKVFDLKKLKPPFTVKYLTVVEVEGTFQLPNWVPAEGNGVSIEQATFSLNAGEGVTINNQTLGVVAQDTDKHHLLWKVNGFCAVKSDDYGPSVLHLLPHVYLMAREYELYGFKGSSQTWNDIGLFMNNLMMGREQINIADNPALTNIINSTADNIDKIKLMYSYLQNNFRYVCVSLGIGGWQPQAASFTLQNKYGDCKALALVMKTMLKKAGIASCIVLIHAGKEGIDLKPGFPHSYFNHAILCVPLPNDTIWLECTSATNAFNYLGSFTSNRRCLMIFDGGATVVKTPLYGERDNLSTCLAQIKLNEDNSGSISAFITKKGELQDGLRSYISMKDAKNIESGLYDASHLKNLTINDYSITHVDQDKPVVSYTLNLKGESVMKKTEARIFIKTDVFTPVSSIPEKDMSRKHAVHVYTGYTQSDTLIYTLPAGYVPENFKANDTKDLIDNFGYANCSINYVLETGELKLIRNFCLKDATYNKEQYPAFRDFLLKALQTSCPELVLKKKE